MKSRIQIDIVFGTLEGKVFVFDKPTRWQLGRDSACDLQILAANGNNLVSRQHCFFEITPPKIVVHDQGSRNGTFVNGERLGSLENQTGVNELSDRDEVRVGDHIFLINIFVQPECQNCQKTLRADWVSVSQVPNVQHCAECSMILGQPSREPGKCVRCNLRFPVESEESRLESPANSLASERSLCEFCRARPEQVSQFLSRMASPEDLKRQATSPEQDDIR